MLLNPCPSLVLLLPKEGKLSMRVMRAEGKAPLIRPQTILCIQSHFLLSPEKLCFSEGSFTKSSKSSSLCCDCTMRDCKCRGGGHTLLCCLQHLGSESHNSNPCFAPAAQAPVGLASQHRSSNATTKIMPVSLPTFLWWPFPRFLPGLAHAMASYSLAWTLGAADDLLQEQSLGPTKALATVPGHCSWCAPSRAHAVQPFSACPGTQEACGKARNKTVARTTSWQPCACLNH